MRTLRVLRRRRRARTIEVTITGDVERFKATVEAARRASAAMSDFGAALARVILITGTTMSRVGLNSPSVRRALRLVDARTCSRDEWNALRRFLRVKRYDRNVHPLVVARAERELAGVLLDGFIRREVNPNREES